MPSRELCKIFQLDSFVTERRASLPPRHSDRRRPPRCAGMGAWGGDVDGCRQSYEGAVRPGGRGRRGGEGGGKVAAGSGVGAALLEAEGGDGGLLEVDPEGEDGLHLRAGEPPRQGVARRAGGGPRAGRVVGVGVGPPFHRQSRNNKVGGEPLPRRKARGRRTHRRGVSGPLSGLYRPTTSVRRRPRRWGSAAPLRKHSPPPGRRLAPPRAKPDRRRSMPGARAVVPGAPQRSYTSDT